MSIAGSVGIAALALSPDSPFPLWFRACPLWRDRVAGAGGGPGLEPLDTGILTLPASLTGQLGTSLRTVQRRIHAMMHRAGAETRIQLGWRAARNGWACPSSACPV